MKVTCTHENLYAALQALEPVDGKNISLPILENILIEAAEGTLFFSATNLEIGVIYETKAKIEEDGSIVVPSDLLSRLLRALKSKNNVELSCDDANILSVSSGSYKTKINGLPAKDFPIIPQSTTTFVDASLSGLQEHLGSVMDYVTHNEIRLELTGVYMQFKDKEVWSAATDSFRLGEKRSERRRVIIADNDDIGVEKVIIPPRLSSYINRLAPEEDLIQVAIADNHLFLVSGEVKITARLLDGAYPDYTQIIPKQSDTTVIMQKSDLEEAMRVMSIFSGKEMGEVKLSFSDDGVDVSILGNETGEGSVTLKASVEGPEQVITVNPRYILEGLKNVTRDEVFVGVTSSSAPVLLRGSGTDGVDHEFTYIVMPVKSASA